MGFGPDIMPSGNPLAAVPPPLLQADAALRGAVCPWGLLPWLRGTRAVAALLRGDFAGSFICHPLVLYTAAVGGWFLASQTIERVSRHRIRIGMRYRDGYVWAALGIVVVNFVVKNLLLILWDVDLLENFHL